MGNLSFHNIQEYIDKYNCSVFIETGTGIGNGLNQALQFPFEHFYSIEFNSKLYTHCIERFKNESRCILIHNNSVRGLQEILPEIPKDKNILFWLDAHFPGADYQLNSYTDEQFEDNIRLPLIYELYTVFSCRPNNKDVFIIDDWRMYENGPYDSGNIDKELYNISNNAEYIFELFKQTHDRIIDYHDEGYFITIPKGDNEE